ncbi:MAG: glycosyltransferase family 9 protein [Bdellovibrionales bacterium]
MKILFITSNRLGDAVLSTGLLAWLAEKHPAAHFTIACGPYSAGLFRAVPGLERLIILEKKGWNRHWLELWQATIGTRWDLVVDLRNSLASRLLRRRKLALRRQRAGAHKVIENAATFGLRPPPVPHIWLDAAAELEADTLLPKDRPLLAFGPAANWPCKQWPAERFAALAQKLTAPGEPLAGAAVLVLAEPHERAPLEPLLNALPSGQIVEIIGCGLLPVAACLRRCRLFIGNDSGLMHVAAALGTPTLGLFGPGYEEIYGPWGPRGMFIRTPESREELLARLPDSRAREPNLMTGLNVEKVYDAARRLLARTDPDIAGT